MASGVRHTYTIPDGELLDSMFYTCKIEHILTDDPDPKPWFSGYDIWNTTGGFLTNELASSVATYLATAEAQVAHSNTQFVGAVVRPWQKMTAEQEIANMISVPFSSLVGVQDEGDDTEMEMDRVLVVSREPVSGKRGRIELRNSLAVTDTIATDHLVALDPASDAFALLEAFLTSLAGFSAGVDGSLFLSMIGRVQTAPTIKHAAAEGSDQEWEHIMSAPISRLITAYGITGIGKRQVKNK